MRRRPDTTSGPPAARHRPGRVLAAAILSLSVMVVAPGPAASALRDDGLPNVDRRVAGTAPVPAATRQARAKLADDLGPLGQVRIDPTTGGVSSVGSADRLLTAPSSRPPREVVLEYVRAHRAAYGLDERDVAQLQLVARSVGPDGIEHLRFNQVLDGIWSFDSGIDGHVTADGRLINVSGTPIPGARLRGIDPALPARDGLREARAAVDGPTRLPQTSAVATTPERTTTFAGGERAVLRWSPTADGPRLAWSVTADADGDRLYDVLVDARSGALLRRQDLTSHLGRARYFGADPLRTPVPIELTMPPAWYDDHEGGTRLWGQDARTYVDPQDEDPAPGSESGGDRVQIPASSGGPLAPDWLYAQSTDFPDPRHECPISGCTWDFTNADSKETNQFQAATNAHVLVSRFHDYLLQPPIGFDEASGNFQHTNLSGSGVGDDSVRVEVNDGEGLNNANFSTPPDGTAPRMQMFLYNHPSVNGSDAADVVYHEYSHGLSNRLVVNASGSSTLSSLQPRMMGEGWSDFYALDLLVHEGHVPDTAAPGELVRGYYTAGPSGSRTKPIDCPVDPAGRTPRCNGGPVVGGYTYGDLAVTENASPHNGGELWSQTLWDIRTALGREAALALVTGGMRLAVDNPSMLDMRDAILQQAIATRSAPGAADDVSDTLWTIFRNRGMGADASTSGPGSTAPAEGFGALSTAGPATLTDPYPGGDDDGAIEPGEQFEIRQPLRAVTSADVASVRGTLTSGPGATVVDGTAAWPLLGGDRQTVNEDPLAARLASGCAAAVPLTIALTSTQGTARTQVVVDPRPGSSETQPLADATGTGPGVTTSSFDAVGGGALTDVDLRIDELRHGRLGDLRIELLHDGVTALVVDRFGGDPDISDALFDSDATRTLATIQYGPVTGRLQPQTQNALDAFDGHPVAGRWTLRVTDLQQGVAGTLHRWGIVSPQQGCGGRLEIPAVQTDAAAGIEPRAATISGTVTPNGRETASRFAFGATTAYGETSAATSVGNGDVPVRTAVQMTGLQPGTTYHYRLEALREGGQVAATSPDRTFTTASTLGPLTGDPPRFGPPPVGPPTIGPPGGTPPPAAARRPAISGARVALTRAGKRKARRRAAFSFAISAPATVTAVVARVAPGIRRGKRCVAAPRRRHRRATSCTRRSPAGGATTALRAAGRGTLRLSAAGLGTGRYTATLMAVDAAGARSAPVVVRFAVR